LATFFCSFVGIIQSLAMKDEELVQVDRDSCVVSGDIDDTL
jgi:hypothetical protein